MKAKALKTFTHGTLYARTGDIVGGHEGFLKPLADKGLVKIMYEPKPKPKQESKPRKKGD